MKKLILILLILIFSGCQVEPDVEVTHEDGSYDFPYLLDEEKERVYNLNLYTNFFLVDGLSTDCSISITTEYYDYDSFDFNNERLEFIDFSVSIFSNEITLVFDVKTSEPATISLNILSDSLTTSVVNCN